MKKIFFIFLFLFYFCFNSLFIYGNESFLSDFKIELQRPSYIKETGTGKYLCDEEKDECKVNFKLVDLEDKDISKTKYNCEIIADFELPEFSNNCNPTTIIIPENTKQKIIFKITDKNNLDNFIEKEINIENMSKAGAKPLQTTEQTSTGSTEETSSGTTENTNNLDFKIELQRPSYIKETGTGKYLCDEEKDECKVNFKLVDLEDKDISKTKFNCEIIADFELPEFSNNCNPTTIVIPENTKQKIIFKITDKNNINNSIEKEIIINNLSTAGSTPLQNTEQTSTGTTEQTSTGTVENTNNFDFNYILQRPSYVSKIDKKTLKCDGEKDECKINFKFIDLENKDISSTKYNCEIIADFELPEFSNNCNPTTITLPDNLDQTIKIKISDKNNPNIFKEKEIFIDNTITHYLPNTRIEVQGKITKYKKLNYKSMTCYTYNKCGVNFTSGIYDSTTDYKWDFRNGEIFYGYNPKTVYFEPGFYRIKLITSNKFGNRKVEQFKLTVKQLLTKSQQNLLKNNFKNLINYKQTAYQKLDKEIKITKLFNKNKKNLVKKINKTRIALTPNKIVKTIFGKPKKIRLAKIKTNNKSPIIPFHKGNKQVKSKYLDKKLSKNIKLHISFQKKNLKISGNTFPNKIVKINIGKQEYKTFSNSKGIYSLKINNLTSGKYKILASVFDKNGKLVAKKQSREKIISKKYITQLNKYKYKKYLSLLKKKNKKYKNKIKNKIKKYKIENKINYASIIPINNKQKFNFKIFAINILITILSIILTSFVLVRKKII